MSIYQKLTVATATAVLSLAAMEAKIQAATITYDFTIDVTSGPLTDTEPSGFFSYDNSTLTGTGLEALGVNQGLSIAFNFLGDTYNETNDIDFPAFPIVQFQDRQLLGLSFVAFYAPFFQTIGIGDTVDVSIGEIGRGGGSIFAYDTDPSVGFEGVGEVTYTARPVPEPSSVAALSALGLGFLLKRVASRRQIKATEHIGK